MLALSRRGRGIANWFQATELVDTDPDVNNGCHLWSELPLV